MIKILSILGTRPEAIKMGPVILELRQHAELESIVCITAQHRHMLDQALCLFDIVPDIDLNLMQPGQTLPALTARVLTGVDLVLQQVQPELVLVQGDTTTVMAVSLAAFYRKIAVGHIEAGLRSHDIYSPFPEELNRRIAAVISRYHFAPTPKARETLLTEGVPAQRVYLTGNTVIDALQMIVQRPPAPAAERLLAQAGVASVAGKGLKLILVTAHRRENFGQPFENICRGLKMLAQRNPDITIIYPVHLNPQVRKPVERILQGCERILLTEPVSYDVMAHLMNKAYLILTDSGGIQEEAPALGKPVLVMRTHTERTEGIEAGSAKLIGPYTDKIVHETERLLHSTQLYKRMATAVSPYGDGKAAQRIVAIILQNQGEA